MKDRKKQRLPGFNYSTDGAYFVTICVQNMQYCFGNVENETMALNQTGKIVDHQWNWIFEQYAYVHRDEFVVMPNHVHGILHIAENGLATRTGGRNLDVGNGRDRSLQAQKIKTISELIGAFKTTSSKMIHLAGQTDFKWQKSYYDRVLRNERELHLTREYIVNNPKAWELDKNNPDINGNNLFL
ncbi:MAG: hypothetical protein GYA67_05740 [Smithella sp.]|jgi:REP element-mobilizing transposase RayT|nr:hypothetical protein [Smithella sp.]HNV57101.1 hypothetical protein [Smithellaceae bacterium]HNY96715.1 hypothetical protein [Smithellaceae bacterium]HOH56681.1 hypothetical protein [Smithellaceae bacterium]HPV72319.1 hypothetical protein [Smithellaceae bacterium]